MAKLRAATRYSAVSVFVRMGAAIVFAALLPGCGHSTPQTEASPGAKVEPAKSLADTEWRLLEVQSMDDAIGTKRVGDTAVYTMRLDRDGTVSMRLDCNRASGSWLAQPGTDESRGSFRFTPLAATRALCPPPRLDEEVVAQAQYVRSYLLKDGRLYLSLMADGGIFVWERQAQSTSQATRDAELEAAVLSAAPSYTKAAVDGNDSTGKARYSFARADLNGDGKDEVFVYLMGRFFCGTGGCNLMVFTQGSDGYSLVNNFPISRLPVIVSSGKTAGWNDLWRLQSGGGAPATYVRHVFDGKRYAVREHVPADKVPEGSSYLAGDIDPSSGIPLEPRN